MKATTILRSACLGGAVAVYRTQSVPSLAAVMASAPRTDAAAEADTGYPIRSPWRYGGVTHADTCAQRRIGYPTPHPFWVHFKR